MRFNVLTPPKESSEGERRLSPGILARLGVPVGGRVRKLRAVEGPSASIPEEVTSELGGIISSLVQRPQRKAIIRSENKMYDYKTRPLTGIFNCRGQFLSRGSMALGKQR